MEKASSVSPDTSDKKNGNKLSKVLLWGALLTSLVSTVILLILMIAPNTYTRLNDHIQSEADIRIHKSKTIMTLQDRNHCSNYTYQSIPSNMFTIAGISDYQYDRNSPLCYRTWTEPLNKASYCELTFRISIALSSAITIGSMRPCLTLPIVSSIEENSPVLGIWSAYTNSSPITNLSAVYTLPINNRSSCVMWTVTLPNVAFQNFSLSGSFTYPVQLIERTDL
jgi:hypothetical protein